MWITLYGIMRSRSCGWLVSKSINFNFVREMKIDQDFDRQPDGRYLLSKSDVLGDFGINLRQAQASSVNGSFSFKKFVTGKPLPDSFSKDPPWSDRQRDQSAG